MQAEYFALGVTKSQRRWKGVAARSITTLRLRVFCLRCNDDRTNLAQQVRRAQRPDVITVITGISGYSA